jgi:hypothetical protein
MLLIPLPLFKANGQPLALTSGSYRVMIILVYKLKKVQRITPYFLQNANITYSGLKYLLFLSKKF